MLAGCELPAAVPDAIKIARLAIIVDCDDTDPRASRHGGQGPAEFLQASLLKYDDINSSGWHLRIMRIEKLDVAALSKGRLERGTDHGRRCIEQYADRHLGFACLEGATLPGGEGGNMSRMAGLAAPPGWTGPDMSPSRPTYRAIWSSPCGSARDAAPGKKN